MRVLTIGATIVVLGLSGAAVAQSPCDLDPPTGGPVIISDGAGSGWAPVIEATSGGFSYCTPRVDEHGNNYPLTGYPMTCRVSWLTVLLDEQTDLEPGQLVEVAGLSLRWNVDPIEIACRNVKGEGVAFVRPALFPAALPGTPYVPGP